MKRYLTTIWDQPVGDLLTLIQMEKEAVEMRTLGMSLRSLNQWIIP